MSDDKRTGKGRAGGLPRDRQPLRRPGERAPNKEATPNNTNTVNSILSPTAKEFVPRSAQPDCSARTPYSNSFVPPAAAAPAPSANGDVDDMSLSHVRTIMYEITMNPGKFDYLAQMLVDALNVTIRAEPTLRMIVDEIFEQSLTESNFRYNGSRLCNCLSKSLSVQFNHNGFRNYLLIRCQQEFDKTEALLKDAEGNERLRGFAMLLGELFIHLEIVNAQGQTFKVRLLGETVPKLLDALLTIPSKENLKCVCQMLKFTGAAVEDQERAKNNGDVPIMNKLFANMKQLALSESIERNSKDMLLNVIELRAIDWGRTPSASDSEEPVNHEAQGNEPVLYGPDGLPISPEEALFLESNQYLYDGTSAEDECNEAEYYGQAPSLWSTTSDDMDDEMVAEFEKFLLENS